MNPKQLVLRPHEVVPGTARQHAIAYFLAITIGVLASDMTPGGWLVLGLCSLPPLYALLGGLKYE